MDCLHFIKTQHDALRSALSNLAAADGVKVRRTLVDDLARDVQVYVTLEKDYLYPEISGLFPGADVIAAAGVANGAALIRRIKALKTLVAKNASEQDGYPKRLKELEEALFKHFEQEEQVLMPKMRSLIRTEDREDLGQVFLEVQSEILAALSSDGAAAKGRKRA
jgi:hypothetical protein